MTGLLLFKMVQGAVLLIFVWAVSDLRRKKGMIPLISERLTFAIKLSYPLPIGIYGWRLAVLDRLFLSDLLALALTWIGAWLTVQAKRDLGEAHTWAGYRLETASLVRRGVYAWMRHPLYTGIHLFIGGALLTLIPHTPPLMLIGVLVLVVPIVSFLVVVAGRETRRLAQDYGEDFRAYQAQTHPFFPLRRGNEKEGQMQVTVRIARMLFYLILNLVWPLIRPLARRMRLLDLVFVVYPGSLEDVYSYVPSPQWLKYLPTLSVIGFLSKGRKTGRAVVVAVPHSIEALESDPQLLSRILERIGEEQARCGAKRIALAGRLPSIALQLRLPLHPPFVRGTHGTVYTLMMALTQALSERGLEPHCLEIGIMGVGFVGGQMVRALRSAGFQKVVGFDIQAHHESDILSEVKGDPAILNTCDVIVVLTPRGSDLEEFLPYLKPHVILIDSAFPLIPKVLRQEIISAKEASVYQAALSTDGARWFPRLPGFQADWLPGCVVEALVESASSLKEDRGFGKRAASLEFKAVQSDHSG